MLAQLEAMIENRGSDSLVRWPVPEEFVSAPAVAYRNQFAEFLAERSVPEIVERFVYMSADSMDRLVRIACRAVGAAPLRGVGVELGSGCGLLSATVAKNPDVRAMFSVEVCEQSARLLIPKVAASVLGSARNKVVPVMGSFDDLRLPDDSVDFIVEIDSLHHSDDLPRTLRECKRVLRRGGRVLCLDRCHPDHVSDEEVERMLSQVYSREFLIANAYPPDVTLTRRDNGEHEYRLFEWKDAFAQAGLRLVRGRRLAKEVRFYKAIKGCLSLLPAHLRRLVYKTDNASLATTGEWLVQPFCTFVTRTESGRPVLAPKETTVFLLEKP